jgi:hypothetical protein
MNYKDSLSLSKLGESLEERYGQYGHVSEECVRVCLDTASSFEGAGVDKNTLAAMLLFTMANESAFDLNCVPNTNKHPEDPTHWDVGPFQCNIHWTTIGIIKGHYKKVPNWAGDLKPERSEEPFNGDTLANANMAAQILLDWHGPVEEKVVHYTGPDHQSRRRDDWRRFSPMLQTFFENYQPNRFERKRMTDEVQTLNDATKPILEGIARNLVSAISGFLVAHGVLHSDQITGGQITSIAVGIVALLITNWHSIANKLFVKKLINTAISAPPGTAYSAVKAEAKEEE